MQLCSAVTWNLITDVEGRRATQRPSRGARTSGPTRLRRRSPCLARSYQQARTATAFIEFLKEKLAADKVRHGRGRAAQLGVATCGPRSCHTGRQRRVAAARARVHRGVRWETCSGLLSSVLRGLSLRGPGLCARRGAGRRGQEVRRRGRCGAQGRRGRGQEGATG